MDPRVTGPNPERYKFEYIPAIGFTTSQEARNHVCDLFLDHGDCDYLIMIDNDMKPLHPATNELANVMHLPAMGLPIVAAPAPIIRGPDWFINGYYRDYESGWRAMALEELEEPRKEMAVETEWGPAVRVDSAGFGCVCIRRDVLAKVRASGIDFLNASDYRALESGRMDRDYATGVSITRNRNPRGGTDAGEDLLFCRRAKELGYQTYMAPACIMGHYHTVDLGQMTRIRPSLHFPDYGLPGPYPMPNDWSISVELANYLRHVIRERNPRRVLELGAGISTLVIADELRKMDRTNSYVETLEEDLKQAQRINAFLERNNHSRSTAWVWHSPLINGFYGWDIEAGERKDPIDLLVVDGPSGHLQSRGQASRWFKHLSPNAIVILDDVHRPYEKSVTDNWGREHDLCFLKQITSGERVSWVMFKQPSPSAA